MNELVQCLTAKEEIEVESRLRDLYILQDKPIKKDQFATMLSEIVNSGKPFKAIMAGLYDLRSEDLKKISYPIIMNAIFDHCEPVNSGPTRCEKCSSSGFVVMRDDEMRSFALACTCQNGDVIQNQGNVRWNGESTQFVHGRLLHS